MVAVAKRDEAEARRKVTVELPEIDLDLAQTIATHRGRVRGGKTTRLTVMCEALRRGLRAMAEEEGVRLRR